MEELISHVFIGKYSFHSSLKTLIPLSQHHFAFYLAVGFHGTHLKAVR